MRTLRILEWITTKPLKILFVPLILLRGIIYVVELKRMLNINIDTQRDIFFDLLRIKINMILLETDLVILKIQKALFFFLLVIFLSLPIIFVGLMALVKILK